MRKFHKCSSPVVKVSLFKAFCTPMYTAHLWCNYKTNSMHKLKVAYNDALRLLMRVPRWHSASQLFVNLGVPTCQALLRNLMYKFMCRIDKSVNSIVVMLINPVISSSRFSSMLWRHWRDCLYWHWAYIPTYVLSYDYISSFMFLVFFLFFMLLAVFYLVFCTVCYMDLSLK